MLWALAEQTTDDDVLLTCLRCECPGPSESGLSVAPQAVTCVSVAIWTWKHDSKALTVSVDTQCHDNPSVHISPSHHQARYVVSKYSQYLEAGKWQWQWPELLTSVTRGTVQTLHYITQVNWPGSCDKWTTERWGQRFSGKTSYNFEYINLSRLSKSSKKSEY